MYVSVLPTCMHVHRMCAWSLRKSEEGISSPRIGVMNGCGPPCGAENWTQGLCRSTQCSSLPKQLVRPGLATLTQVLVLRS